MSDPSSSSSVTSTQAWAPSTAPPDSSSPSAPGPIHTASSRFSFPPAAQPEIVRAYQKDVYYRDILRAQLSDVVRGLLGTRVLHTHADAVTLVAGLAYYALSSLGGTQTLGEEYVNAMMVESKSGRITALKRRSVFIALHVLAPFILARIYSSVRRAIVRAHTACEQAAARARFRAAATRGTAAPKESRIGKLLAYFSERLPALDSLTASDGWLAYAGAAHLALFYLGGRYYGVAQRLAGVQYISTIARRPGSRPPSYEVLGFLLGTQLLIKLGLSLNAYRRSRLEASAKQEKGASSDTAKHEGEGGENSEANDQDEDKETVRLDSLRYTHRSSPPSLVSPPTSAPVVPLSYADPESTPQSNSADEDATHAIARGKAEELEAVAQGVLRCTLCMEQREPEKGTSAVTECGHVFCWECIVGWAREKPECPLCRQALSLPRILPIYNF